MGALGPRHLTHRQLPGLVDRNLTAGSHHLLAVADNEEPEMIFTGLLHSTNVELDTELLAADEKPVGGGRVTNLGGLQLFSEVPDVDHVVQSLCSFLLVVKRYDLLTTHLDWSPDNLQFCLLCKSEHF